MFNPALIKPIIGLVASHSAARVTSTLIRANLPAQVTTYQKVTAVVGTLAIGSAVGSVASKALLDDIEKVEEAVKGYKEAQQEKE
jgi:uncharacterized membrane protein YjjB (DUF3815 family)